MSNRLVSIVGLWHKETPSPEDMRDFKKLVFSALVEQGFMDERGKEIVKFDAECYRDFGRTVKDRSVMIYNAIQGVNRKATMKKEIKTYQLDSSGKII